MKPFINGIIVVEGSNDASFISSLIDAEIVVLNGCELQNIKYLKKASECCNVLLMTDPDDEGRKIRARVLDKILNCINIEIDINKCSKGMKNGIAECENNEVLRVLSPYFEPKCERVSLSKILTKNERRIISRYLDIEEVNNKQLNKRLSRLKITDEELNDILKGI